ncbi:hypothetical protein GCM10027262_30450 [Nocardia tengchongensis]
MVRTGIGFSADELGGFAALGGVSVLTAPILSVTTDAGCMPPARHGIRTRPPETPDAGRPG